MGYHTNTHVRVVLLRLYAALAFVMRLPQGTSKDCRPGFIINEALVVTRTSPSIITTSPPTYWLLLPQLAKINDSHNNSNCFYLHIQGEQQ